MNIITAVLISMVGWDFAPMVAGRGCPHSVVGSTPVLSKPIFLRESVGSHFK